MSETVAARSPIRTRPLGVGDPETLGPYRLLGILGVGGMGCVYLGRDSAGRTVAVKVVRQDLAGDNTFRSRFRREVAAARRVAGPHTVPVYDADVDGPRPWLATGYVSGPSLTDAVEGFGPLPESSLIALAAGLARALIDVHATGMVHRDLKPSNVLMAQDGPRVIDFGIARTTDDETALTTTGKIIGSPGYMSPEQITGGVAGPPGDVFALGGLLVYAATGSAPFGTGDTIAMLWRVIQEEPRLDGVPERVRGLAAACLAKNPEDRPTPARIARQLAALRPPGPDHWLPAPILAEIHRRAAELAELEAIPPRRGDIGDTAVSTRPGWGEPRTATASVPDVGPRTERTPGMRRGRRPLVIGGVAAAALLAAVAIGVAVTGNGSGGAPQRAAVTTANPGAGTSWAGHPGVTPTESPATHGGEQLPAGYVGSWKGSATDGTGTFDVAVTLQPGKTGQEIGTVVTAGRAKQGTCTRKEMLTLVGPTRIMLRARHVENSPAKACARLGVVTTLEHDPDGTLTYTNGMAADLTGILHRGN
ncbi:serine/threonine-protein kinase [Nocardia vaccinii]|uniref:serine/threonine-protein kinase n=1 Tax=Nocardia vaccinii TaxID=1822 RepID=UPI0008340838|nr:serine/threonine-protein kinase [Nocardia vaccinii]